MNYFRNERIFAKETFYNSNKEIGTNLLNNRIYTFMIFLLCLRVRPQHSLRGSVSWPRSEGEIEPVLLIQNRFISNIYNCSKRL